MRVTHIEIQGIKGIAGPLILQPKSLCVISGDNGVGKSSILDALKAVFQGGHNPQLVRQGAKRGEIVLTLDSGSVIRKVITPKASTLTVTDPEGREVKAPQTFVESLASGFGFDPIGFVEAEPKKRTAFLLDAMPISFTAAEIAQAVPMHQFTGDFELGAVEQIREDLYAIRRAANVAHKQLEGTITTLRRGVGQDEYRIDWKAAVDSCEGERDALKARTLEEIYGVKNEAAAARQAAQAEYETQLRAISTAEADALQAIAARYQPEREELAAKLATAKEKLEQRLRAEGARAELDKMTLQLREKSAESAQLSSAIEALDALKKSKLAALPVEGVEIREGEILVGGLPFDSLNTAKQFTLAFEIAALKPGDLGLMVADRAETLGPDLWKEFCAAAEQSGFQVITARVDTGPLVVDGKAVGA
jgi:AAA domain